MPILFIDTSSLEKLLTFYSWNSHYTSTSNLLDDPYNPVIKINFFNSSKDVEAFFNQINQKIGTEPDGVVPFYYTGSAIKRPEPKYYDSSLEGNYTGIEYKLWLDQDFMFDTNNNGVIDDVTDDKLHFNKAEMNAKFVYDGLFDVNIPVFNIIVPINDPDFYLNPKLVGQEYESQDRPLSIQYGNTNLAMSATGKTLNGNDINQVYNGEELVANSSPQSNLVYAHAFESTPINNNSSGDIDNLNNYFFMGYTDTNNPEANQTTLSDLVNIGVTYKTASVIGRPQIVESYGTISTSPYLLNSQSTSDLASSILPILDLVLSLIFTDQQRYSLQSNAIVSSTINRVISEAIGTSYDDFSIFIPIYGREDLYGDEAEYNNVVNIARESWNEVFVWAENDYTGSEGAFETIHSLLNTVVLSSQSKDVQEIGILMNSIFHNFAEPTVKYFQDTIVIYSYLAIILSAIVLLIIIIDLINSIKKDVNVFKVLGYSPNYIIRKTFVSYLTIILIGILVAIPITLLFTNLINLSAPIIIDTFRISMTTYVYQYLVAAGILVASFFASMLASSFILKNKNSADILKNK